MKVMILHFVNDTYLVNTVLNGLVLPPKWCCQVFICNLRGMSGTRMSVSKMVMTTSAEWQRCLEWQSWHMMFCDSFPQVMLLRIFVNWIFLQFNSFKKKHAHFLIPCQCNFQRLVQRQFRLVVLSLQTVCKCKWNKLPPRSNEHQTWRIKIKIYNANSDTLQNISKNLV